MTTRDFGRAVLAAGALATAAHAQAGLGERAESVAADRSALGARSLGAAARPGYAIERMASAANEVREFVSPTGVVFGVAWDGISHPDLSKVLASYAPEVRQATARPGATGRRRRVVRTANVVVETWGHMRSLHGRAWVPALVPPGVSADAIR